MDVYGEGHDSQPCYQAAAGQLAVVGWASVAAVMTAPGQTAAVSLFTDPLIAASLRISRTQLSASDTGNASVSAGRLRDGSA